MTETNAYKLYWSKDSAAEGPAILMDEAGIEHEKISVDLSKGENWEPHYLAVNPTGYVPALLTPEGSLITEAGAILLYLCERHRLDLAPTPNDVRRATFLRFLFFFCTTVPVATKRYWFAHRLVREPSDIPWMQAESLKEQERFWKTVDDHLNEGGPFMLGDKFSVLDIQLTVLVPWHAKWQELLNRFPALKHCYELTIERPAVQRALQASA